MGVAFRKTGQTQHLGVIEHLPGVAGAPAETTAVPAQAQASTQAQETALKRAIKKAEEDPAGWVVHDTTIGAK